ncbi:hypothetical protein AJ78_08649 [Emergomyces pasteurianus Ep9510]|uniref:Uncharacterized protein n=1 Tax=Emergomyces pasteurianus Ep9510 TaxID=1447872 RepID=A0A1J9Q2X9_9EURO|nr:hypothetical protein AJ78_08649 [Emergomyces pasteurianus Ep9510]
MPIRETKSTANDTIFPLADGFSDPSPEQIRQIEEAAHGSLSNALGLPTISREGLRNLRWLAFHENFDRNFVVKAISAAKPLEELHALTEKGASKGNGMDSIQPSKYNFPVSSFLTKLLNLRARSPGKIPCELMPFLTTNVRNLDFPLLHTSSFPGSSSNDAKAEFQYQAANESSHFWVAYINQQHVPLVLNYTVGSNETDSVTIQADFPHSQHLLNGLTIATLTNTSCPFEDAMDASNYSVHGAALIIVN